ncbi:MAG: type II toxin-antitoxin system RelE/ParE family toxin [Flavobacteriales bacterium]|nr:type II toxin-antitoxin system RelE/ParE family toxin [Flavobacteriales bacterium]
MKSGCEVIWTDEAYKNLNNTLTYIEGHWSEKELRKFARLLEKQLQLISQRPLIFPEAFKHKDVRRAVLSRQTTIYYKVKSDSVEILSLFDNRQDPRKLKMK